MKLRMPTVDETFAACAIVMMISGTSYLVLKLFGVM